MGKFDNKGEHHGKKSQDRRPFSAGRNPIDRIAYGKAQFRKKQDKERQAKLHEKATMLRNYAKICKREGIVSDRVHIGPNDESSERPKKLVKPKKEKSSLQKEYEATIAQKKLKEEEEVEERRKSEELRAMREKKRKEESKKRMQKTKKGQPILGNQVKSILSKLQS